MLAFEMRWSNLTPFMSVLMLISRVIHRSTLHFAVAEGIVYQSNTWEKTWQGESLEHMEQFHIKFVEKLQHLKQRGRKAFG